jgi:hypothetical protein
LLVIGLRIAINFGGIPCLSVFVGFVTTVFRDE